MTNQINLTPESSSFIGNPSYHSSTFTSDEILLYQGELNNTSKVCINNKWHLVKRIKQDKIDHPTYLTAFNKEFEIGYQLDHPNIVKYINKGTDAQGSFILMEFIEGRSLKEIINEHSKIKDKHLLDKIIKQLLEALNYLHSKQVYHLDLKPDNILITTKGNNLKLIDFGFADNDSYINALGGTKKYAAPELFTAPKLVDGRSDLYSLGLLILELHTGYTESIYINQLPKPFNNIVKQCLELLPKNRFQSADEVLQVLEHTLNKKKYLISGIVIIILLIILFFIIRLSIQKDATDTKITAVHSILTNQATYQDSVIKVIKKDIKNTINAEVPTTDSIICVQLGNELYSDFMYRKSHLNKNSTRSIKLQLVTLMDSCENKNLSKWDSFATKYTKFSSEYIFAHKVFAHSHNSSMTRISEYIFNQKKNQ